MSVPGPEQQIDFLTKLQRLRGEGAFVATYKYALLMALSDISVERGTDDDALWAARGTGLVAGFFDVPRTILTK
jgi:hypothetical protein